MTRPHGGDMEGIARRAGVPAESLLDFSANLNPAGLPARAAERLAREARDRRVWMNYPDPEACELRSILSRQLDVPMESIVVGAGAASLIDATMRALAPDRCVIPIPAFSEYERASRARGCAIHRAPLTPGRDFRLDNEALAAAGSGDLFVLNNPHNPSGACSGRAEMLDQIAILRSAGACVLVDEAFIDYAPECAVTRDAAGQAGVVAIRSLTKLFGCAGLRAGYAVANRETSSRVAEQLSSWPVTTLALNAVSEALRDPDYLRETLERNERARALLSDGLQRLGCRVFPSRANFLFVQLPEEVSAVDVRDRLIREHAIVVRECESFAGLEPARYLRIAVRLENENVRLLAALTAIFENASCPQHN